MKKSNSGDTVLVDSDAFVGLFYTADAHHQRASAILEGIKRKQSYLVTTSLVIAETATVLSHREGQDTARAFLDWSETLPVIHISEELQKEALSLFKQQHNKGNSVVDCANVAVMKRFGIPTIFSFDKVY